MAKVFEICTTTLSKPRSVYHTRGKKKWRREIAPADLYYSMYDTVVLSKLHEANPWV